MNTLRSVLRIIGVMLLQLLTLLLGTRLIGAPIMSATIYRVPLGSCYGYDLDFRFMIGLTGASLLLAVFLAFKGCRVSTVRTFLASLILLDVLYATHIKFDSPCF